VSSLLPASYNSTIYPRPVLDDHPSVWCLSSTDFLNDFPLSPLSGGESIMNSSEFAIFLSEHTFVLIFILLSTFPLFFCVFLGLHRGILRAVSFDARPLTHRRRFRKRSRSLDLLVAVFFLPRFFF